MTEINNISDLVRVLEENPEWLYTLRGMIFSKELAEVPTQLGSLEGQFNRMESQLNRMEGKVDNLSGPTYELKVAQKIDSIAGQHLQLLAVRIGHGQGPRRDESIPDLLEAASDESPEKADLVNEVRRSDLIISGRRRGETEREYALFEASITVSNYDINRAAQRANTLFQLTGRTTRGVVIGDHIPPEQHELAVTQGVTAITYRY